MMNFLFALSIGTTLICYGQSLPLLSLAGLGSATAPLMGTVQTVGAMVPGAAGASAPAGDVSSAAGIAKGTSGIANLFAPAVAAAPAVGAETAGSAAGTAKGTMDSGVASILVPASFIAAAPAEGAETAGSAAGAAKGTMDSGIASILPPGGVSGLAPFLSGADKAAAQPAEASQGQNVAGAKNIVAALVDKVEGLLPLN